MWNSNLDSGAWKFRESETKEPTQGGRRLFIIPGGAVGLQVSGDLMSLGYTAREQELNSRLEEHLQEYYRENLSF